MGSPEECKLRDITDKDLSLILRWRNSEHVRKFMFNDKLIEPEQHFNWFNSTLSNRRVCYKMFEFRGIPSGLVYFTDIDENLGTCQWGFYLGEEGLPKGTGLKMGVIALDYAFGQFNLNKIFGEVISFNKVSRQFHKKLGFSEAGCRLEQIFRNENYYEVYIFEITKNDWYSIREKLQSS